MDNLYVKLSINKDTIEISAHDHDAFCYIATFSNYSEFYKYCEERANDWKSSDLLNYSKFSTEHRNNMHNKWLNVKNLSDGNHPYYFNLKDKETVFREGVEELAKELRITNYKLVINE